MKDARVEPLPVEPASGSAGFELKASNLAPRGKAGAAARRKPVDAHAPARRVNDNEVYGRSNPAGANLDDRSPGVVGQSLDRIRDRFPPKRRYTTVGRTNVANRTSGTSSAWASDAIDSNQPRGRHPGDDSAHLRACALLFIATKRHLVLLAVVYDQADTSPRVSFKNHQPIRAELHLNLRGDLAALTDDKPRLEVPDLIGPNAQLPDEVRGP